jgi:hypothetical protein
VTILSWHTPERFFSSFIFHIVASALYQLGSLLSLPSLCLLKGAAATHSLLLHGTSQADWLAEERERLAREQAGDELFAMELVKGKRGAKLSAGGRGRGAGTKRAR